MQLLCLSFLSPCFIGSDVFQEFLGDVYVIDKIIVNKKNTDEKTAISFHEKSFLNRNRLVSV